MGLASERAALLMAGSVKAIELRLDDEAVLQKFFDDNPRYFLAISDKVANASAAREQLEGWVPADMTYSRQFSIGFVNHDNELVGVADVVSDLLATDVWHIGLFMIASSLHGRGFGSLLYQSLEAWIKAGGARWIRLGVVIGNSPAERFWARQKFVEVNVRRDVLLEGKLNDLRVMVKPLDDNVLSDYQVLVARDQPVNPSP